MNEPRLALIGCGNIAEFHVAACRAAGLDFAAVCSRPGSPRLRSFSERHHIPLAFDGVSELLKAHQEWDAAIIAVSIDSTMEVLEQVLEADAPVLVEKPVAWRSADLLPLLHRQPPVIVGYNRRFYRTVRQARKEVASGPPLIGQLMLPEAVSSPNQVQVSGDLSYLRPFFGNSVHGLDLARFVFGELQLVHVQRLTNRAGCILGLGALFTTSRGDVLQFTANWGAPANFSLTLDRPGRRLEVRPFEAAAVYEGMEVTEPTSESPVRSYRPRLTSRVALDDLDRQFKPGFVAQARALAALARGEEPGVAARLEDAYAALELAERLVAQACE